MRPLVNMAWKYGVAAASIFLVTDRVDNILYKSINQSINQSIKSSKVLIPAARKFLVTDRVDNISYSSINQSIKLNEMLIISQEINHEKSVKK